MLVPNCFYDDVVETFLRETDAVDILTEYKEEQEKWNVFMVYGQTAGFLGSTLSNNLNNQWAIITQEPNEDSEQYRYTVFDNLGFLSHQTYDSLQETLVEAFNSGYTNLSPPTTLDDMARIWSMQPQENKPNQK